MRFAALIAVLAALVVAAPAQAAISQATATATAQRYQNSECGKADYAWLCANAYWQPQYCYSYGNTRWYCSGTVQEKKASPLGATHRYCQIDVQVGGNSNTIVYHYNYCRH